MKSLKEGMQDGIPIALGYVSVSFTFGLMAVNVGMSWWQAVLISMTCITWLLEVLLLRWHFHNS